MDMLEHEPLVHHFKKHRKLIKLCKALGDEDAEQTIWVGMMQAAKRFDPSKGRFSTYAFFWIRYELAAALRASRMPGNYLSSKIYHKVRLDGLESLTDLERWKYLTSTQGAAHFSLDAPRYLDGSRNTIAETDVEVSDAAKELEIEQRASLAFLLDSTDLQPRERYVLYAIFFEEKTLNQIGGELHITLERVRQIREKAFAKIREAYE